MKNYIFETTCVSARGIDIINMRDDSREITYETMLKHCSGLQDMARSLGYVIQGTGLKLKDDFAVSFHKSQYRGKPCYYFVWSDIEHIWIKD